jgi:ABC-type uncharacterized transport system substrate-binding protein
MWIGCLMPRWVFGAAFGIGLLGVTVPPAEAHPHVWIDYRLTVLFEHGQIAALRQNWSFDEDFSAAVLRDVAGGKALKKLGPKEVKAIEQNAFSNLKNYGYFTHVFVPDGTAPTGVVTDFNAVLAGPKLVYTFTVPLAHPVAPKPGPVGIGVWDDTYYVDVGLAAGSAPELQGDGSAGCQAVPIADHQHPIYFGSVYPTVVKVTC